MHICPKCQVYNLELNNCTVCKLREELDTLLKKVHKKEERRRHKEVRHLNKSYFDYVEGTAIE